jgi:hypothetical protein
MKTGLRIVAAVLAAIVLTAPAVWADSHDKANKQPSASPSTSKAPDRIEGEVIAIDHNAGTMTVRMSDGTTQQFHGNKETLKDYKVGDRLEGRLRQQPSR